MATASSAVFEMQASAQLFKLLVGQVWVHTGPLHSLMAASARRDVRSRSLQLFRGAYR